MFFSAVSLSRKMICGIYSPYFSHIFPMVQVGRICLNVKTVPGDQILNSRDVRVV